MFQQPLSRRRHTWGEEHIRRTGLLRLLSHLIGWLYCRYGTEEDSLGSFYSLQMIRPRKNWAKINAYDGKVLRYHAKFAEPASVPDMDREFTVSFFPASDSLAIYEPPKKNSGVLGGKFLAKTRLRNPETGNFFCLYVATSNLHLRVLMQTSTQICSQLQG